MTTSAKVALHLSGFCIGYMAAGVFLILYLRDTSIAEWLNAGPAGWAPDLIPAAAIWIAAWIAFVKGARFLLARRRTS